VKISRYGYFRPFAFLLGKESMKEDFVWAMPDVYRKNLGF